MGSDRGVWRKLYILLIDRKLDIMRLLVYRYMQTNICPCCYWWLATARQQLPSGHRNWWPFGRLGLR